MVRTCCAMTERTSISILLNSSRHVQEPVKASPVNNFSIIRAVIWSEQLKTMQYLPNDFAKSLQD
jgi:hypothetical protein